MKNEGNIDFRATTRVAPTKYRRAKKRSAQLRISNYELRSSSFTNLMNFTNFQLTRDPVVGQFMQADNYVQTPEDYIGYNRYSYCKHNPFKYTDPSGESWQGSGGGISGGGGGFGLITDPIQANKVGTESDHAEWLAWIAGCDAIMAGFEAVRKILTAATGGSGGGSAPASGAGTGGVSQGVKQTGSGIYIQGDSTEKARIAGVISRIIGDQVVYDPDSGKILGRRGLDNNLEPDQYTELRDDFDNLITNTALNGKSIDLKFESKSAKFHSEDGSTVGAIRFSSSFLDKDYAKYVYYPTTGSNNFNLVNADFGQIVAHELFGHGLDWVNDYQSPFNDTNSRINDLEDRAVAVENLFAYIISQPFRHHH